MGEYNTGFKKQPIGFATKAIHYGQAPEQWSQLNIVTPIVTSTVFKFDAPDSHREFEYGRTGNPTRRVLETSLATLDTGKYGLTFASGLGAITTVVQMLNAGDHIISCDDIYGGTSRFFRTIANRHGFQINFVDAINDLNELENTIKENTKMIWLESPTNPCIKIIDIEAVSKIAHTKNPNIIVVVDNSFLSSYFLRPLELGADIVVHSISKYMNGHSDVIMGAVTTNSTELYEQLKYMQNSCGSVPSPFDCYQVLRSLKTLNLRMEQHQRNALGVAQFLETHQHVKSVLHPGLPSHPQHKLALRQSYGHSGIMSFYINGGAEECGRFFKSLKMIPLAESLGGYESLISLPNLMSHASVPENIKIKLGITDSLVRLSVGLEDVQHIIDDLNEALNIAHSKIAENTD